MEKEQQQLVTTTSTTSQKQQPHQKEQQQQISNKQQPTTTTTTTTTITPRNNISNKKQPKIKNVWCAVDCGIIVNPDGAKHQIEGGVIDGIGHAMYSQLTFDKGVPNEMNFDKYQLIRHSEAPEKIEVFFVKNDIAPTGLGEPGLPPAVGALANALYQLKGKRYYKQPFALSQPVLG